MPLAGSPASGAARGGLGGASPSEISGPGGFELDEPGLSEPPPPDDDILKVDPDDLLLEDEESPPESGAGPVGGVQTLSDAMRAEEGQPPLTPPPESGEEPAPQVQIPKDPGPTMEQLGNTIQLDEAGATDFELDDVTRSPWRSSGDDARESSPAEEPATLPPGAREELDRVRLGQVREVRPVAIDRPVISTNVVDFVSAAREFEPETFLELLDSSLSL